MATKAYRLLRAVLMTAATEDKMIPSNLCQIRGAGLENPEERPVLSLAEVFDLANRMKHPRYQALILLSVFVTLRCPGVDVQAFFNVPRSDDVLYASDPLVEDSISKPWRLRGSGVQREATG